MRARLKKVTRALDVLKGRDEPVMRVTDHAVIRFLERSGQVDVNAIRREIASACVLVGSQDGRTEIPYRGMTLLCSDGAVVTTVALRDDT